MRRPYPGHNACVEHTGAETWLAWKRAGILQPTAYDRDVADFVRRALRVSDTVPLTAAMDAAGWTARDLVRVLAGHVSSFAGMLRGVMRLLERIGATAGTKEGMRLSYAFDDGDPLDATLEHFRETVTTVESILADAVVLSFPSGHLWSDVLSDFRSWTVAEALAGSSDAERWPYAEDLPQPAPTGDVRVDAIVARHMEVILRIREVLATIGDHDREVTDWAYRPGKTADPRDEIAHLASDHWVLLESSAVHAFADAVATGATVPSEALLVRLEQWLDAFSFDSTEIEQTRLVERFEDVLNLPMWGKRHDLYAVWVLGQLDLALAPTRLRFIVRDGALSLPFTETLVATMSSEAGEISLFSERRSDADDVVGAGRRRAIQPDYRFVRSDDGADALVVEVKQYRAPAATRHAVVLRDYVVNTQEAPVFLVGHGPLGDDLTRSVPEPQKHRARSFADVRVGMPAESAAFRAAVADALPAAPSPVARVELTWDPRTPDLDLHVVGEHEQVYYLNPRTDRFLLREDTRNGGPEIVDVLSRGGTVVVRVHVFSGTDIASARPVITVHREDGSVATWIPSDEVAHEHWWQPGGIDAHGAWVPAENSEAATTAT